MLGCTRRRVQECGAPASSQQSVFDKQRGEGEAGFCSETQAKIRSLNILATPHTALISPGFCCLRRRGANITSGCFVGEV